MENSQLLCEYNCINDVLLELFCIKSKQEAKFGKRILRTELWYLYYLFSVFMIGIALNISGLLLMIDSITRILIKKLCPENVWCSILEIDNLSVIYKAYNSLIDCLGLCILYLCTKTPGVWANSIMVAGENKQKSI